MPCSALSDHEAGLSEAVGKMVQCTPSGELKAFPCHCKDWRNLCWFTWVLKIRSVGDCHFTKIREPFSTGLSTVLMWCPVCQLQVLSGLSCPNWGSYFQSCFTCPVLETMLGYGEKSNFASLWTAYILLPFPLPFSLPSPSLQKKKTTYMCEYQLFKLLITSSIYAERALIIPY